MSPVATRMPSLPAPRRAEEFARLLESGAGSTDRPLSSMLTVARGLQSLPTDGAPSEEFRVTLRKRLVAVAAVQAQAEPAPATSRGRAWAGSWQGWQGQRKIAVVSGTLAALVAVAGVAVGASRSLPGDPLYGVKRGTEAAQLFVTNGDVDRGNRHLDYARTRLQEISDLLKPGSALGGGALGQPLAAAPAAGSLAGRLTDALKDMDSDTLDGSRDLTEAFRDQHDRGALLTLRSFATQQHHQFVLTKEVGRLFVHPFIQVAAAFVDFLERLAHEIILLHFFALGNIIDVEFGFFAQVITFHQDLPVRVTHIDPLFPGVIGLRIKQVHLHAGIKDVLAATGGPGAVTYGNFPGNG